MSGALISTLATMNAKGLADIGDVIFHRDSSHRANFLAQRATNATRIAHLTHHFALFFGLASHGVGSRQGEEGDQPIGASLHALTASTASRHVYLCPAVHNVDGIKRTG